VTFAAGAAFGGLFFALALLRHYRQRSALRRELRRVEAELERLRGLPPPDAD
jgi:membrane associated rhomboid family serine protease